MKKNNETTRAKPLKLVVPRDGSDGAKELRQALQTTTSVVAHAACAWARLLLAMRQDDVLCTAADGNRDGVMVSAAQWRDMLVSHLGAHPGDSLLQDFKSLYGLLVQSHLKASSGKDKGAQTLMRPLLDRDSRGGQVRFELLDHFGWMQARCLPAQKKGVERVPGDVRDAVKAYIEENPSSAKMVGSPPVWRKEYDANGVTPDMCEMLLKSLEKKTKEIKAFAPVERLLAAGLLPVQVVSGLDGPATHVDSPDAMLVMAWEWAALSSAVSMLNSWESWHHRMIKARLDAVEALKKHEAKRPSGADVVEAILPDLTMREIRGWDLLRGWLHEHPGSTEEERGTHIASVRLSQPKKYGSDEVLRVLAANYGSIIADAASGGQKKRRGKKSAQFPDDPVYWLAKRNRARYHLEGMRLLPRCALVVSDGTNITPNLSVVSSIRMDAPGNRNLPQYEIRVGKSGLIASIPLLYLDGGGKARPTTKDFSVALPQHMPELVLQESDKKTVLHHSSQDGLDVVVGNLTGGTLQVCGDLSRQSRKPAAVYLRVGESVNIPATIECSPESGEDLPVGTRLQSVDLGVRAPAACSVFVTTKDGPVHERSFILRLPGDKADRAERDRRRELTDRLEAAWGMMRLISEARRVGDREEYRRLEHEAAMMIGELRGVNDIGGNLSVWRISFLTDMRILLLKWNSRSRIERPQRGNPTGYASRLLQHIGQIKRERARCFADSLVQSARGRVYERGQWVIKYDPIQVLLMDGLQNYKSSSTLSKDENRRLAIWCHREITANVKAQAQLYGIAVVEGYAAYSSSYHAMTGMAGTRFSATCEEPQKGGPILVVPVADGGVVRIDADVNAAQNMGYWYLTGYHPTPLSEADRKRVELLCCERLRHVSNSGGARTSETLTGYTEISVDDAPW